MSAHVAAHNKIGVRLGSIVRPRAVAVAGHSLSRFT